MADELVPLCQCWNLLEAQSIRASLAARGVRVTIEGEHQRGVLGMMGTAIALRVMVPRSQLSLARELASEIIPGLGGEEAIDADEELLSQPASPARRDLGPDPLEDTSEDEPDEDDDEHTDADDEHEGALASREAPRKKSIAVALVVGGLGMAVGTLHLYAGERRTGIALLGLAGIWLLLLVLGQPTPLLLCVWAFDIVRGIVLIRRHNAAIDEQARKARLMLMN